MNEIKISELKTNETISNLIPVTENEQNEVVVSGRDLHNFLEIGTQYTKWFDRMKQYGFSSKDYEKVIKIKGTKNYKNQKVEYTDHILKLDTAKAICSINSRTKKSSEVFRYLNSIENKIVFVHKQPRMELTFAEVLKGVSGIQWEEEHRVLDGKYRIDFYNSKFNLAIEYDEKHHSYYKKQDELREKEITNLIGCHFIRVKEGEELKGIKNIMQFIYKRGA